MIKIHSLVLSKAQSSSSLLIDGILLSAVGRITVLGKVRFSMGSGVISVRQRINVDYDH